jgi:hypothetical protein
MAIVYKDTDTAQSDFSDSLGQKYTIENLQYPSTIDSSPEFGYNKVVFFINVQGGGKFAQDKKNSMQLMDVPQSEYENYLAGKSAAESIGEVASIAGVNLTVAQKMKRLSSAIVLYVPNNLRTGYSVNWSDEDFQKEEMYAEIGLEIGKMVSGDQSTALISKTVGAAAARKLNGMDYAQKALKITPGNAKAEQLFKGVNFRDFTFDYQFVPRSEKEAESVMRIIRMFRHHMLPEFKDQANFLYIYPSEFEIRYYKGAKENQYVERHMTCVLTNMIVDYTPNGQFNTFPNGMSTQINMSLTFRELSVTTKETSPMDQIGV